MIQDWALPCLQRKKRWKVALYGPFIMPYRVRRRTREPSAPMTLCTWSECNARLSSKARRPCQRWCSLVKQIHYKRSSTAPIRSSRRHSRLRAEFSAATLRCPCEYTRSFAGKHLKTKEKTCKDKVTQFKVVFSRTWLELLDNESLMCLATGLKERLRKGFDELLLN